MQDALGRAVRYLRLSLTPACQMRCVYCRPALHTNCAPDMLGPSELEALALRLVEAHGVRKIRLTGGDPTARPDLLEIIERLARIPGLGELAMTTNGLSLASRARRYVEAGLSRVNVSLDSLDPARFARMTGVDALPRALEGVDAALEAGLTPVKLNTVVLRDENLQELPELVRFAAEKGVEIRFIELMPMGPLAGEWRQRYVPEQDMRRSLDRVVERWRPLAQGSDSARRFRVGLRGGGEATVGFITPMSCNFCAACDRIRIASDGAIYPCLMDRPAGSILPAIRPRFDGELLDRLLRDALARKQPVHPERGFVTMTVIGG
ncbi:MAG: GTP 3',8-cyclase MoaA [Planctomycetota bacterium]|nr:MAG: GTP 3',8-cyclase MoaA [Planctomycetota bacterium]